MIIDASEQSANKLYYTMTQTIIPRPIAWVLSDNGEGVDRDNRFNLAPFSYFTPVSSSPPLLMFSVGKKPDGTLKDTRQNILQRDHFVVHICDSSLADKVTKSSATLPHGVSEVNQLGLELVDFDGFSLPRVKECKIAYGCHRFEIKEIGNVPQALIFGLVTHIYIDDSIVDETDGRLKVSAEKVDPLARTGGDEYWVSGRTIAIKRPE